MEPFIDSPKRPQDRIPLACDRDRPGDRPVDRGSDGDGDGDGATSQYPSNPAQVTLPGTTPVIVEHGHVVIASITSCTNASNPSVMIGAGMPAKKSGGARLEITAVGEYLVGPRAASSPPASAAPVR
ncbi:aconitase family protein [Arthrobacter psychrochitiniphilus]|uniref:aconitase family protein n=1 Tax=Arthrobacter psychrochitiniphilus TaxID=291045 RepID=UPI003F7CC40E